MGVVSLCVCMHVWSVSFNLHPEMVCLQKWECKQAPEMVRLHLINIQSTNVQSTGT